MSDAYGCSLCGVIFPTEDDLAIHVMTHPGRFPFEIERASAAWARRGANVAPPEVVPVDPDVAQPEPVEPPPVVVPEVAPVVTVVPEPEPPPVVVTDVAPDVPDPTVPEIVPAPELSRSEIPHVGFPGADPPAPIGDMND